MTRVHKAECLNNIKLFTQSNMQQIHQEKMHKYLKMIFIVNKES
jgi:hypothetical protein